MTTSFNIDPAAPKRSRALIGTVVVVLVLVSGFLALAGFLTDRMWFESVGQSPVFDKLFLTRAMLFVGGLAFATLLAGANVFYAFRSRPAYRVLPDIPGMEKAEQMVEQLRKFGLIAIPLIVGLFVGTSLVGEWDKFLLYLNRAPFGKVDAAFGLDLSFFVFELPFLEVLQAFLMSVLVVSGLAGLLVHYLVGSIRPAGVNPNSRPGFTFTPGARRQIAVMGALFLLLHAWGLWLERYRLVVADNDLITGIRFVDENVNAPALSVLFGISILCALLFLANLWRQNWTLPILGAGLLIISTVLIGSAWPAVVQQVQVKPDEQAKEAPYIAKNIEATRLGYGLDQVSYESYDAVETPNADVLINDRATLSNIRLMDPIVIASTIEQLQQLKGFYGFSTTMDVSRYTINGETRGTMLAVREVNLDGIPESQRNWVTNHLIYTHGIGLVAAYDNTATVDGEPSLIESDVPPTGLLGVTEPRVYFGEQSPDYSIVGGSGNIELDYPDDNAPSGQQTTSYEGEGGVPVGSLLQKLFFAARFGEANIVLSEQVSENSRILFNRKPADRVAAVAPWLTLDSDPYAAVVDGRIVWIIDAYTTSSSYPYSQLTTVQEAVSDSSGARGSAARVNYIRNSVKATVDAYNGTVTLYAWDESDPVLKAWRSAFPELVKDKSEMAPSLLTQVRYPEDLFKVQRDVLRRYHITDPNAFFTGENFWIIPSDPTSDTQLSQPPYYMNLQMPGETSSAFSLTTTFAPAKRPSLAAFMSVNSEAGDSYGKIRVLQLPSQTTIPGPVQAQNIFESNAAISTALSLLRKGGSDTVHGNLLSLPVGGGILYVEPIYVKSTGAGGYPLLRKVLVGFGQKVVLADTIAQGLSQVLGTDIGDPNDPGPQPDQTALEKLANALAAAQRAYDDGQAAIKSGDWAGYGAAQRRLSTALAAAQAAEAQLQDEA